jgi:hypothetical protein
MWRSMRARRAMSAAEVTLVVGRRARGEGGGGEAHDRADQRLPVGGVEVRGVAADAAQGVGEDGEQRRAGGDAGREGAGGRADRGLGGGQRAVEEGLGVAGAHPLAEPRVRRQQADVAGAELERGALELELGPAGGDHGQAQHGGAARRRDAAAIAGQGRAARAPTPG